MAYRPFQPACRRAVSADFGTRLEGPRYRARAPGCFLRRAVAEIGSGWLILSLCLFWLTCGLLDVQLLVLDLKLKCPDLLEPVEVDKMVKLHRRHREVINAARARVKQGWRGGKGGMVNACGSACTQAQAQLVTSSSPHIPQHTHSVRRNRELRHAGEGGLRTVVGAQLNGFRWPRAAPSSCYASAPRYPQGYLLWYSRRDPY